MQQSMSTHQNATAAQSTFPQPTTSVQPGLASRPTGTMPMSAYATSSAVPATRATVAPAGPQTANSSVPLSSALGQYGAASTTNGTGPQLTSGTETQRHQSSHYEALQQGLSSQVPPSTPLVSSGTKTQNTENPPVESTRPRNTTSAPHNLSSSHGYPIASRQNPPTSTVQQTHQWAASVPTQPPLVVQNLPSPRKFSHPLPASSISTQPFPSKSSPPQPLHVPASGHQSTVAPPQVHTTPLNRLIPHDLEILNTPSSLAQSPMPPPAPVPVRQRHVSMDSKDSVKKKFFNLFKPKSGSKENSALPAPARASVGQQRPSVDIPTASMSQRPAKEHKDQSHAQQPATVSSSTHPSKGAQELTHRGYSVPEIPQCEVDEEANNVRLVS